MGCCCEFLFAFRFGQIPPLVGRSPRAACLQALLGPWNRRARVTVARRWASRLEAVEVERKQAVVLDGKEGHEGPANEVEEQIIIQDELSKLVARL